MFINLEFICIPFSIKKDPINQSINQRGNVKSFAWGKQRESENVWFWLIYHCNFHDIFKDTRCMLTALIKVFPWISFHFCIDLIYCDIFFYFPMTTNKKKNQGRYSICQIVLFIQKSDWWHLSRALIVDMVTFDLIRGLKAFNKRKTPKRHLYTVIYLIIEIKHFSKHSRVQRETIICKQK